MSEEQTEQSQEPVQDTAEVQSNEPEETIGDIAKSFNVEEQASNFQQEVQPQVEQSIPDQYLDPDGYASYMFNQTRAESQKVLKEVQTVKQQLETQRLESDIKNAVAQIDVEVDDDFKEVYLEREYRVNPDFKKIWDHRYSNPKALNKALKVLSKQIGKKVDVKTDPQLAENQRAAKQSQRTMATTPPEDSIEDKLMSLSGADFDREWSRMRGR